MKSPKPIESPIGFQKFFTIVTVAFLLMFIGITIYNQIYIYNMMMRGGYAGNMSWEVASTVARVAVPTVLFLLGLIMMSGTWWRRSFMGALLAIAGMLTQTGLLTLAHHAEPFAPGNYSLLDIGFSVVTILSGAVALLLIRSQPSLWLRRHTLYSVVIIGAAILLTIQSVMDQMNMGMHASGDWFAMLIAHLILIGLATLAYLVLRGAPRSMRLFRVVLVVMAAFLAMLSLSIIVSMIAQVQGGIDMTSGFWMAIDLIISLIVYAAGLWLLVRPSAKSLPVKKPTKA